jgi:hypothetical protein
MSKQTEALKLALEALKKSDGFLCNWHENYSDDEADAYAAARQLNDQAITAIRVALAEQPAQQEPDAIGCKCSECGKWQRWTPSGMTCKNGHGGAPGINHRLYTTPQPQAQPAREWVRLTNEEIDAAWPSPKGTNSVRMVARIIEAKLKEKNTK